MRFFAVEKIHLKVGLSISEKEFRTALISINMKVKLWSARVINDKWHPLS